MRGEQLDLLHGKTLLLLDLIFRPQLCQPVRPLRPSPYRTFLGLQWRQDLLSVKHPIRPNKWSTVTLVPKHEMPPFPLQNLIHFAIGRRF